ncbi:MAG TPA: Holliday junction resolvase RuvX [Candidatus Limnocylindria bacterium]|nr:Holliday junction resolvase RuvX [Candidatus Limnocylindria bacterium]
MKIIALDIGDVHTGIAISDALGILARPLTTVPAPTLTSFLTDLFQQEQISTALVGYPKTLRGTISDQTKKVEVTKQELEQTFPTITWLFWDERLSSKRADTLKKNISKEEKLLSHARAAAFILTSYLDYRHFHAN